MTKQKITILYERLSHEDELQGTSNSIINQRQLLEEYAEKHGLIPYIHIQDDGYSGTRWDRPGWQELTAKVEAGEVSCICIKDSTRLGRDYLRAGLFREMLREKGIRLIAVNDNYDSAAGEDDFTPFREIMAEWYARDTSKKIRAVVQSKGRSGKPLTYTPPYGFIKDPNDKNKWLVDPDAAAVVKRMFQMTIDGIGVSVIAKTFAAEKIERPSYYLGVRGRGRHKNDYDRERPYAWTESVIAKILRSAEYAGHTVNFRTTTESFKSKKMKFNDPEDWLIFPNTHEAIVDQQTFDLVQKLRQTVRRHDNLGEANPLTGLLWCADCGAKMYNHRKSKPPKPTCAKHPDSYECSNHKLSVKQYKEQCTAHYIGTDNVRGIILAAIRATSGYVRGHEKEFIERVRESSAIKHNITAKAHQKQINKNEKRIAEIDRIYKSLYEDKALGKIPEETFESMTEEYLREKNELNAKSGALRKELDEWSADNTRADKFIEIVKRHTDFHELTPAMLNEFIDKVLIYEAEWSDGRTGINGRPRGKRTQRVDVYLKYIGNFDLPETKTPEELEAERAAYEKRDAEREYQRLKMRRLNLKKRAAAQVQQKAQNTAD